jgi:sugar lactone lactonase YvrE/DNA-binding IclR family transcriptional regulator
MGRVAQSKARETGEPDGAEAEVGGQPGMQALTRGLSIIELVAAAPKPVRFRDLLESSGLPKGTLHRILQTLVEARYLKLDGRDQTYRLGARPFELAHRVWDQFDLRGAASPELERLCALTGEAVRLGVLDADSILYIDQREAPRPLRVANGVGARAAVHASALGKAIVSHLAPAERHRILTEQDLRAFTDHTIVTTGDFERQLNIIKARGYAISVGEQHEGISAVAAPILDHKAEPLGAIGILGPTSRLPEAELHALGREVMESARRISGNIGELAMSLNINPRPLGVVRDDVACAIPGADFLGEGPHWIAEEGRLLWVDILAPAVLTGDPATGAREAKVMPELVGVVVPKRSGGYLAATETGLWALEDGGSRLLAEPERDRPGNRFNDGKCDARGRFWVGSLAITTQPDRGRLWRYDPDGALHRMEEAVHISNGLGWSPDNRRFYFTDSGRRTIWVYDFDLETGGIANRRVFVEFGEAEGVPDGLCVDAEGHVWSAHWDGWCVTRYDPDGRVERVITLPVPRPTSCAFGGPAMTTLYVTSARVRLSSQQLAEAPLSGSVLAVETGIRGLAPHVFGG